MKTRAGVLRELGSNWEIVELDLDEPKDGEVLIRFVAAGLCHSDEHLRHGDIVPRFPIVGGHEGAGIIEKVGPGVTPREGGRPRRLLVHARLRALPLVRDRPAEHLRPRARRSSRAACPTGRSASTTTAPDVGGMCMLGTFSQYSVISETSCVKVDNDLPLDDGRARRLRRPDRLGLGRLRGRRRRRARPWSSTASAASAPTPSRAPRTPARRTSIAVDPLPIKRETAEDLGATHSVATRRGGARARAGADPRRRRRQGDHHRRRRQRGGRRRGGRGDPQGRHRGHHRPRRPDQGHRPALGRGHDALREDASRARCSARRNPMHDIPKLLGIYQAGQAQARRAGHQDATRSTSINQGYDGPAGRQEHPGRGHPRALTRRHLLLARRRRADRRPAPRGGGARRRAGDRLPRRARGPAGHRASRRCCARLSRRRGARRGVRRGQRRADARAARRPPRPGARARGRLHAPTRSSTARCSTALREGRLLYIEELNRVPEETLNVLVGALAEGEIHVPRLGRIPAGARLPPDRGDEPVRRGRHRAREPGDRRPHVPDRDRLPGRGRRAPDRRAGHRALGRRPRAHGRARARLARAPADLRMGASVRGAIDATLLADGLRRLRAEADAHAGHVRRRRGRRAVGPPARSRRAPTGRPRRSSRSSSTACSRRRRGRSATASVRTRRPTRRPRARRRAAPGRRRAATATRVARPPRARFGRELLAALHDDFTAVSPAVGRLDLDAFEELMRADSDAALALLHDLARATDPVLRAQARRLAARLTIGLARSGTPRRAGVRRLVALHGGRREGDLDLERTVDRMAGRRRPEESDLVVRTWRGSRQSLALLVDHSGSMRGHAVALAGVSTAAMMVALRGPRALQRHRVRRGRARDPGRRAARAGRERCSTTCSPCTAAA